MDRTHVHWLMVNRTTLLEANVPAMHIVDHLISRGMVYDPRHDDYQRIAAETTIQGKTRILLDTLPAKPSCAFSIFKQALYEFCPHVLAKCVEPPHALADLASAVRSCYKNVEVKPFTWLKGAQPLDSRTFFLNLSVVDDTYVDGMMSSLASSSAAEIKRQEYLYSLPAKENLVHLDSLFDQFCPREKDGKSAAPSKDPHSETSTSVDTTHAQAPGENTVSVSSALLSGEEKMRSCALRSAKRVSIYGGAGCGKTSCLLKIASMYAEKRLWPEAHAFLLWKLRDREVQKAQNLEQLLRLLKLSLTEEKCKELAAVLEASEGEGVILALDGIDELDTQKNGIVWSLLDGSVLSEACVLATSRPSSIAKTFFNEYDVNLELLGFTEEQVDQFVEQQFVDKPELASELNEVLLGNPTLGSLMLVPLLAMMVCQVFRLTAKKPPTTRTLLYSKLIALVIRRAVDKREGRLMLPPAEISSALEASDLLTLSGTPKNLVCELAELAAKAHEEGKAVFDHAFVKQAACSDHALELGLLCSYSGEQGVDIVRQYFFQHLTVQEFLVAYRLNTHITSESELQRKVNELICSQNSHIILQFFAGLLPKCHHPTFFTLLNQWLHRDYDQFSMVCRSRLKVVWQCAKEACGADVMNIPCTFQLPKAVVLDRVTAADLIHLSLAVRNSQHIEVLRLSFDDVRILSKKKNASRLKTQTRQAMTKLMAAISTIASLRELWVDGPKYSLFEEEGWRSLVTALETDALVDLMVVRCELDNTLFQILSNVLKHNTKLTKLKLYDNNLNDASVRALADDLEHNRTLQQLNLCRNSYGEASRGHLLHQLGHIKMLRV